MPNPSEQARDVTLILERHSYSNSGDGIRILRSHVPALTRDLAVYFMAVNRRASTPLLENMPELLKLLESLVEYNRETSSQNTDTMFSLWRKEASALLAKLKAERDVE